MQDSQKIIRYSVINDKNPREIVLLRGVGCSWSKCTFCDYHLDSSANKKDNFAINRDVLACVDGRFSCLEVINSGSFAELDCDTMNEIEHTVRKRRIRNIIFEAHWIHRKKVAPLKARFANAGAAVKVKAGVETFDFAMREGVLNKGFGRCDASEIADYFDQCCLLQGLHGQTSNSMISDIETALSHFERVCVNVMQNNSTKIRADEGVVKLFIEQVFPKYSSNSRVDLLLNNTDFGVGGKC